MRKQVAFFATFDVMKKFDIPDAYRSPIITKIKAKRKLEDPRKQDFSPSRLQFGTIEFSIARHFGFCYGVENAIEKSYKAIQENPGKRIYLLSEMIHNPEVNDDLLEQGLRFIQDTSGQQLVPWDELQSEDIVIIPAFGTTLEISELLTKKGLDIQTYNTTCPFVEKVWNRSSTLGDKDYTIIIHGKHEHEETKATFSHSRQKAPSMIVRDMDEAQAVADFLLGKMEREELLRRFQNKLSDGFDPERDLTKIGVVNQTTMLATETQEIVNFLYTTMVQVHGLESIRSHFADTRDTLCYATNDNQSATLELLKTDADLALVIGGYNSSNTSHLVELLEQKFTTYFIKNADEIKSKNEINAFNLHKKKVESHTHFLPEKDLLHIVITAGASCPDSTVDQVIRKILLLMNIPNNHDVIA